MLSKSLLYTFSDFSCVYFALLLLLHSGVEVWEADSDNLGHIHGESGQELTPPIDYASYYVIFSFF